MSAAEVFREIADRKDFQERVPENALPPVGDELMSSGREDPLKGVEEAILFGVDHVNHVRRNSIDDMMLSIQSAPQRVNTNIEDKTF